MTRHRDAYPTAADRDRIDKTALSRGFVQKPELTLVVDEPSGCGAENVAKEVCLLW